VQAEGKRQALGLLGAERDNPLGQAAPIDNGGVMFHLDGRGRWRGVLEREPAPVLPDAPQPVRATHRCQRDHNRQQGEHHRRPAAQPPRASSHQPHPAGANRLVGEKARQIVGQFAGAGVALVRLLLQTLETDRLQIARCLAAGLPRGLRGRGSHAIEDGGDALGLEGKLAGEALVENGAQRPHVSGGAGGAALGLFGRHEVRRAEHGPGARAAEVAVEALGEAEVGNLGNAALQGSGSLAGEEDVGGLEVAVNDALFMGVLHRPRQRLDQRRRLPDGEGALTQALGQAAGGAKLQREEGLPVVLPGFVDLNDVGVLETSGGLGLGLEARLLLVAGVGPGADHLQRHLALQGDLKSAIDNAHAAAAELFEDLVAGRRWD
jgi:hypothetical protein